MKVKHTSAASMVSHNIITLWGVQCLFENWPGRSEWLGPTKGRVQRISINSMVPGKFQWNFRYVIFKWILVIDACEIALIWMSLDLTDDQSTLVQVMAWCRQATSHYLSQCWPRSLLPYGVTRPKWVKRGMNGYVFDTGAVLSIWPPHTILIWMGPGTPSNW